MVLREHQNAHGTKTGLGKREEIVTFGLILVLRQKKNQNYILIKLTSQAKGTI